MEISRAILTELQARGYRLYPEGQVDNLSQLVFGFEKEKVLLTFARDDASLTLVSTKGTKMLEYADPKFKIEMVELAIKQLASRFDLFQTLFKLAPVWTLCF